MIYVLKEVIPKLSKTQKWSFVRVYFLIFFALVLVSFLIFKFYFIFLDNLLKSKKQPESKLMFISSVSYKGLFLLLDVTLS